VHLFQHIAGQVREKLLDLFLWTGGSAQLYRGVTRPSSGFPLGLDPWAILNEGIRRRLAGGLEEERLRGKQLAKLIAVRPAPKELQGAQLPADLRVLLTSLADPKTLAEVQEMLADPHGRDKDKGLRAAILLIHLGAVKWA
jgi:hypothetical protein